MWYACDTKHLCLSHLDRSTSNPESYHTRHHDTQSFSTSLADLRTELNLALHRRNGTIAKHSLLESLAGGYDSLLALPDLRIGRQGLVLVATRTNTFLGTTAQTKHISKIIFSTRKERTYSEPAFSSALTLPTTSASSWPLRSASHSPPATMIPSSSLTSLNHWSSSVSATRSATLPY